MAIANSLNITSAGQVAESSAGVFTGSPLTQYCALVAGASNAITSVSPSTAGYILTSNGTSADPSFQAAPGSSGSTWIKIATATASNSSSISFTSGIDSTYNMYFILLQNIAPSASFPLLYMNASVDGGTNYLSYLECGYNIVNVNAGTGVFSASTAALNMPIGPQGDPSATSNESFGIGLFMQMPFGAFSTRFNWDGFCNGNVAGSPTSHSFSGQGEFRYTTAVNALKFKFSSGNIASGTFTLYGCTKP
jgi:hypothetical protein